MMASCTGERGRYMFRVASGSHEINYEQKCYNWFANEMRWYWLIQFYMSWTWPCPCDYRLAVMDGRWRFDWRQFYDTNYEKLCMYERMPWWFSSQVRWNTRLHAHTRTHTRTRTHTHTHTLTLTFTLDVVVLYYVGNNIGICVLLS